MLNEFFKDTDLEKAFVIGYYGGGNFGDELLLEVILNKLNERNIKHASFLYNNPKLYRTFHHEFQYKRVSGWLDVLKQIFASNSIIIGGGGLWGMDVNFKILVMSLMLFLSRYILRKKIYLIGVGYYQSTNRLGHIAAWFAAKSAHRIIVRDKESYDSFRRINPEIYTDLDIGFLIKDMDLSPYATEANKLAKSLTIHKNMVYITLRKFKDGRRDILYNILDEYIRKNPNQHCIVSLLQPNEEFEKGLQIIKSWCAKYKNVQILDANCNPLALVGFFKQHSSRFRFITPQYHAILMGIICNIPVAPIAYDNKVEQLLHENDFSPIPLENISANIFKIEK